MRDIPILLEDLVDELLQVALADDLHLLLEVLGRQLPPFRLDRVEELLDLLFFQGPRLVFAIEPAVLVHQLGVWTILRDEVSFLLRLPASRDLAPGVVLFRSLLIHDGEVATVLVALVVILG